jgi:hypothetical protein
MTATALSAVTGAGGATAARAARSVAAESESTHRDEIRLVLSIAFGIVALFVPAAALVVGAVSMDFITWAVLLALTWIGILSAQVTALRVMRARLPRIHARLTLQFAVCAILGAGLHYWSSAAVMGPWNRGLGLLSGDLRSMAGMWGSVLVAAYLVWERELRARQQRADRRLAAVQQAQRVARRNVVDAQLRAMQAQVDPPFFFAALDAIEALYRDDLARAEAAFEELVRFLRAALPTVGVLSTVLGRELDLAAACVRIHALTGRTDCVLRLDVGDGLRRRPFPAGVLLPLVRGTLDAATGPVALGIAVSSNGPPDRQTLALVLDAPVGPDDDVCAAVRDSLLVLFGVSATLVSAADEDGVVTTLSLPPDES